MALLVEDHQEQQIGGIDHTRRAWFCWPHCIANATWVPGTAVKVFY